MLFLLSCSVVALAAGLLLVQMVKFINRLQSELLEPQPVILEDPTCLQPVSLPSIFSEPTKSLSVIIPAYNEEDRLSATLEEIISYLQQRRNRQGPHFTWEIIIVDDGSKDKTVRVGLEFAKREGFEAVRVLRVPSNRGKGHAVKRGMLVSRGEYCLMCDADGATRFSDIEMLEASLAMTISRPGGQVGQELRSQMRRAQSSGEGSVGAAWGSRAHMSKAAAAKRSVIRNLLTKGFHFLVMFVAGGRIRDTQCGFKLYTRRAAAIIFPNQRLQRWCFDVELLYLADTLGVPTTEVFVQWTEMPGSKIRPTSIISMAWELLSIKLAYQVLGQWKIYSEQETHRKQS